MSDLSRALQAANRGNLSYRRIEEEAHKRGHSLSYTTASRYMTGKHPEHPNLDVVRTLAEVFGVSVSSLMEKAGHADVGEPFELPAEAAVLDDQERQAIVQLVKVMASRKRPVVRATAGTVERALQDLREQGVDTSGKATMAAVDPERYDLAAYADADPEWLARRAAERARGEESQENPYEED